MMDGQNVSKTKVEDMESVLEGNKRAAFAGVGGFAAGVAAAVGVERAKASAAEVEPAPVLEDDVTNDTPEVADEPEIVDVENVNGTAQVEGDIPIAEVDNSLSFGSAFRAAREQVGPGGVFVWHGKVYNTFTAKEWASMSPAEHAEFGSHLHIVYDQPAQTTVHVQRPPVASVERHVPEVKSEEPHVEDPQTDTADDADVKILGVEHVRTDDGSELVLGAFGNEHEAVILADIDNDGLFDVAAYDENGNGRIEENELHDISRHQFQVSDMEQAYQRQEGVTDDPYATLEDASDVGDIPVYDV